MIVVDVQAVAPAQQDPPVERDVHARRVEVARAPAGIGRELDLAVELAVGGEHEHLPLHAVVDVRLLRRDTQERLLRVTPLDPEPDGPRAHDGRPDDERVPPIDDRVAHAADAGPMEVEEATPTRLWPTVDEHGRLRHLLSVHLEHEGSRAPYAGADSRVVLAVRRVHRREEGVGDLDLRELDLLVAVGLLHLGRPPLDLGTGLEHCVSFSPNKAAVSVDLLFFFPNPSDARPVEVASRVGQPVLLVVGAAFRLNAVLIARLEPAAARLVMIDDGRERAGLVVQVLLCP